MKNTTVFVSVLLLLATTTLGCDCDCCPNNPPTSGILTPPIISVPTINIPIINLPIRPIPPPNTIPIIPTPTPPQGNCNSGSLSNKFTLSFSYVCRPNVAYDSCKGEVLWNNVIVASIVPNDCNIRTLTFNVFAQVGENSLQFAGAGRSDGYGLLIDNVTLVREGTSQNIVVNGDFSSPDVRGSWGIFNDINGWRGVGIEIGSGPNAYGVGRGQLCELDGNSNYQITQYFTFNNQYTLIPNRPQSSSNPILGSTLTYTLSFDWAIRSSRPESSQANVFWNNALLASLVYNCSVSSGVNRASYKVTLNAGDNILQFDGSSSSDSFGVTIDNVRLVSDRNKTNLIVNGDFSTPSVGSGWNYFDGGILGWSAKKAEVGGTKNYNPAWPVGQCIELDSDSNQRYTQVIHISDALYRQLVQGQGQNSCY